MIGILIVGLHQGQRTYAPHRQAGHMTAADQIVRSAKIVLAMEGRPHMGVMLRHLLGRLRNVESCQLLAEFIGKEPDRRNLAITTGYGAAIFSDLLRLALPGLVDRPELSLRPACEE